METRCYQAEKLLQNLVASNPQLLRVWPGPTTRLEYGQLSFTTITHMRTELLP